MSESRALVRTESEKCHGSARVVFVRAKEYVRAAALSRARCRRANSQQVAKLLNGFIHLDGGADWPLQAFDFKRSLAPQVGLEPTTLRLTANESADPPAGGWDQCFHDQVRGG
jgi:hypothetical protein